MAHVSESKKACAVNPLKMSQPLGASYAFMGLQSCMPVMHGSQGCTSFGLVVLVRHFKEAIPLQTTAMNEVCLSVPATRKLPSLNSTSASAVSMRCAAIALPLAMMRSAAVSAAVPPTEVARLPPVRPA